MSVYSGDFLGFRIGNTHSSQLNITRVSTSDRYSENILPNFTDTTIQVPGGDGTYYWDTYHTQRPFTINFAFDDVRDEDIQRMRQELGFKGLKQLIFDECSYKKYMVKSSAVPTIQYLCFSLDNNVRQYKGEGIINLVAYYPYGISVTNYEKTSGYSTQIDNNGDFEYPIKVYYDISSTSSSSTKDIKLQLSNGSYLFINGLYKLNTNDTQICIDMKTNLIEGLNSSNSKTGTLYNRFINSGDFFKIPKNGNQSYTISSTNGASTPSNVNWSKITYNYLYY